MEKCSVPGSLCYQSYPGQASCSYTSLQNVLNRLDEKQKVRSRLVASSPFCDGSRANFSPYQHSGSPSRVNSVKTIRACASAVGSARSIAQNDWTSLIIHDRRSCKFECTSALNKLPIKDEWTFFGPPALIKLLGATSLAPK